MAYDCTKCYKHIPDNDIWEAFGTLYHQKCAPKNAKKRSKSELATSPSETAGLFSPDPEKAKKQLEPLFRANKRILLPFWRNSNRHDKPGHFHT
jgi:hypothetical protein